jgi:hypothetical protein
MDKNERLMMELEHCLRPASPSMRSLLYRQAEAEVKMPSLIQQYVLIRAIQRKRRYLNIKPLTPIVFHLVLSTHHPRRRVEMSTTRVCITLARLEEWLLPNSTRALNLGQFGTRIRDHPMPASQLHRFPSMILDGHYIGPEIVRNYGAMNSPQRKQAQCLRQFLV